MPVNSPIFIMLNGAPESGKSTVVARGLGKRLAQFSEFRTVNESFAAPMKHYIASGLGIKYADAKKDVMMSVLQGYTIREFLIDLSENYMKRRYYDDIFARLLVHRVLRIDPLPDLVIIDDLGFDIERSCVGHFGKVVRVTRPGKTFDGDSRKHIADPDYHLVNDSTLDDLEPKLDHLSDWCISLLPANRRPVPVVDEPVDESRK